MSEGKYEKAAVKSGGKGKKSVAVMAAVALLLALAVGGTVAYIATMVDPINNQFLPAEVSCAVSGDTPTEIVVTNTGDIPAFIRAAVVVNWMDGEENVYGIAPSYTLEINRANWTEVDGFFYYNSDVAANSNNTTEPLISVLEVTSAAPTDKDGNKCKLRVEVVAEAIQAEGSRIAKNDKDEEVIQYAVEAAWEVWLPSWEKN